jgi:SNF2 family DNA or RNA helicase
MVLDGDTLDDYEDGMDVRRAFDLGTPLDEIDTDDPHISRLRRMIGEAKVGEVVRLLASQIDDSDEKICVFAHHRSVLGKLRAGLLLFGTAYIDGGTAQGDRDAAIARFATDPNCRVFIGQSQACGTGTDGLQKSGAKRLILVEPDWTAENNLQLAKRLARLGQGSDHVIAQMVTLAGTLDEAIVSRNLRETRMLTQAGLRVAE